MERYTSQTPLSAPTKETLALLKNASAHMHKEYISYITGCDADARHKYAVFRKSNHLLLIDTAVKHLSKGNLKNKKLGWLILERSYDGYINAFLVLNFYLD